MYHYIYKIIHKNGRYYVGRHSTKNLNDNYMGSGKWVTHIKDKTSLSKIILKFCSSEDELFQEEANILNEHIDHPLNMNFINKPRGNGTGKYNTMAIFPEIKEKISKALKEKIKNGYRVTLTSHARP